jgi:nickel/cobalt transporter (NicO) family protein
MFSILTGSLIISLLHAVIPNHWLPVIAIGRKEQWTLQEVTKVTFICALAHGVSTILIGAILSLLGSKLDDSVAHFTNIIAPIILISIGLIFIYRHHRHRHFHINEELRQRKTKTAIITALVIAMFFSPCMEIEAYFLLAGAIGYWLVLLIAATYLIITTVGMMLLVRYAYKGLLKLNWHSLEHNAGIITGFTLVITGIISFLIKW